MYPAMLTSGKNILHMYVNQQWLGRAAEVAESY